jgi:hypothetical protein
MEKLPADREKVSEPTLPPRVVVSTPGRGRWVARETLHATLGSSRSRTWLRGLCLACSVGVLIYSVMVLTHVAWMGTIGVRCMFGTEVEEEVPADFQWRNRQGLDERPQVGDKLLALGSIELADGNYADYIRATRILSRHVGETVEVRWEDVATGEVHQAWAKVDYPPTRSYVWSCLWFLQELLIFAVGARVFWKRPADDSARLFFFLCIVTVGAYMGGYHWT